MGCVRCDLIGSHIRLRKGACATSFQTRTKCSPNTTPACENCERSTGSTAASPTSQSSLALPPFPLGIEVDDVSVLQAGLSAQKLAERRVNDARRSEVARLRESRDVPREIGDGCSPRRGLPAVGWAKCWAK